VLPARLATAVAATSATAARTAPAAESATAATSAESAPATTPAATESTTAARRGRTRFVDRQPASVKLRLVELLDGRARIILCRHLNESETARSTGGLIAHDANRLDLSCLRKQIL
jgi:hypothetical protein